MSYEVEPGGYLLDEENWIWCYTCTCLYTCTCFYKWVWTYTVPASTTVPASFVPDESDPTLVPASTPVPAYIHDSFAEEEEVIQELDINFLIKKNFPLPLIFFVHGTYSVSGHYNSWSKEA